MNRIYHCAGEFLRNNHEVHGIILGRLPLELLIIGPLRLIRNLRVVFSEYQAIRLIDARGI